MTEPDDRELDQYLAGGSKLSRRYRDTSSETAPPQLDELVLARARAEVRRKPSLNRMLTPLAVAASLLLGVNLAWRVYQTEPVPVAEQATREASGATARALAGAPPREAEAQPPAAPEPAPARSAAAGPQSEDALETTGAPQAQAAAAQERVEEDAQRKREAELRESFAKQAEAQRRKAPDEAGSAAPVVDSAPAPAAALADSKAPLPLTDEQKIERLIAFIGGLGDAVFIRNGEEHSAPDAAKHLAYKRKRAGDRVKTADDFIRLCASHSSQSGDAYLIRFADGRTRTAEDVLRDELARMEGLR